MRLAHAPSPASRHRRSCVVVLHPRKRLDVILCFGSPDGWIIAPADVVQRGEPAAGDRACIDRNASPRSCTRCTVRRRSTCWRRPRVRTPVRFVRGLVDCRVMPDFKFVAPFEPTGDQPAAIERLSDGPGQGRAPPDAARRDRDRQDARPSPGRSPSTTSRRWSSPTTRRSPPSSTPSSASSSRRTRSSTSSATSTTTSPRRTCPGATPTSRRTRRATTRSTGSATPRPTPCSSAAT